MIIKRDIEKDIIAGAGQFPVVAILGPRQSGKTTLAQFVFKKHRYISLEDLDVRASARQDPRTFLITNYNDYGVIIDEFQYVPELLSYIQTMADKEQKNGYFVLTGSQNFLMNNAISQSLAGRVSIHTLLPLSVHELKKNKLLNEEIEPILYQGGYPAIYAKETDPHRLYKGYMQTYVERDVPQLTQVGDLTTFQTFITLCATRMGQLLNISSLGNECGISDHTVKRWLSILEASYIIFLLHPYYKNFGKRLVKTPKLFFYDTGFACYLLKIKPEELALHPYRGNLFESFCLSELIKWHYNHGIIPNIYFLRDKAGHEIDCVIEEGSHITPIEIKSSRTYSPNFFKNILFWEAVIDQKTDHYVIYAGTERQIRGTNRLISWQSIDSIFKK